MAWCLCVWRGDEVPGLGVCLSGDSPCTQAVQGRLLGLADLAERLCAVVKHEAREEYA